MAKKQDLVKERKQIPKLYWDSGVWSAWINHQFDDAHDLCNSLLKEADLGKIKIITSALVLAEFTTHDEKQDKILEDFLSRSSFIFVEINTVLAANARKYVRDYKIKGADALHLVCAIKAKADFLYTYDDKFSKKVAKLPNIKVCRPEWPKQLPLIFESAPTKEVKE